MRMALNILMALTMVATFFGGFQVADASAETISVRIRSIAANNQGKAFDSNLNDLKGKLSKAFGGYTNFKQVKDDSFTVAEKGKKTSKLPNGSDISVTFHGFAGKFIKLGLGIAGKLNTTLRASPGSTFFQAGLSYKGGILILAITVR